MPFAPHVRVTALGRLGESPERFSYGFNMAPISGMTLTQPGGNPFLGPNQAIWDDLAEDVRAFHGDGTTLIHQSAVLEEVKFAVIGADGRYTEDPVVVNVVDTPGSAAGQSPPPQVALAVSLMTARRGRTGKGRMFLPLPSHAISNDQFLINEGQRDGTQARFAGLINAVQNAPGIDVLDLRVVVASSKGYNSPVTGVRVGKVLDTIRTRRRSLDETYDPATATAA